MAHKGTDGDEEYTFDTTEGENDGPYMANGAGVSAASVSYSGSMQDGTTTMGDDTTTMGDGTTSMDDSTTAMDDMTSETDGGEGEGTPGFGIVAVALALVGLLAVGFRRGSN